MTVPTQPVTVRLADFGGGSTEGVLVTARLEQIDYTEDGIFVTTEPVTGTTDANGEVVLELFPNAVSPAGLGTVGSTIRVTASIPNSRPLDVQCAVPDTPCNLVDILVDDTTGLSPAQLAVSQAQAAALEAAASAAAASTAGSEAGAIAGAAAGEAAGEEFLVAAQLARDQAVAAANATGPASIFVTKAAATAAIPTLTAGDIVEVLVDESRGSARTRYVLSGGVLVFAMYMDEASTPFVIVASGQSNMDGAGAGGTMPAEDPLVQFFDLQTRQFRTLSYTNRLSRTNVNTGTTILIPGAAGNNNLAFAFAHRAHKETGRPVYLIHVSNGGTHIGRWVGSGASDIAGFAGGWGAAGTAKPLYVELDNAVTEALALIGVATIDAFLWHQGETARPGFESTTAFETDLNTLLAQLRAEPWWAKETKFIAGELVPGSGFDTYQEVLRSLTTRGDPRLSFVTARNLVFNVADHIHWDGPSLFELGYYRYWGAYMGEPSAIAFPLQQSIYSQGVRDYYHIHTTPINQPVTIWPLQGMKPEAIGPAPVNPEGGFLAGQRFVSSSNVKCTVVINADGSHTVTPTAVQVGNWEYQYDSYAYAGPQITQRAKVTGIVDYSLVEKLALQTAAEATASINLVLVPANATYTIDWGDGTVETLRASGTTYSHTYASAFTGKVRISVPKAAIITTITSASGKWTFPLSALSALDGLLSINITGSNRISGTLAGLPKGITSVTVTGSNIITGDIGNCPSTVTTLDIEGNNTLSGSINGLNSAMTTMRIRGSNTVSGTLDTFTALTTVDLQGNNTISGTLATLPATTGFCFVSGNNTMSGDFATLPAALRTLEVYGNNTINTPAAAWGGGQLNRIALDGAVRSSTQIDQLLASLALVPTYGAPGLVLLNFTGNAPRTAASDASVATIVSRGGTVQTNP